MSQNQSPDHVNHGPDAPVSSPRVGNDGTLFDNCAECGARFFTTVEAQQAFKKHGYPVPRRCYRCRKKRKTQPRLGGTVLVFENGEGVIETDDGKTLNFKSELKLLSKSDRVTFHQGSEPRWAVSVKAEGQ